MTEKTPNKFLASLPYASVVCWRGADWCVLRGVDGKTIQHTYGGGWVCILDLKDEEFNKDTTKVLFRGRIT